MSSFIVNILKYRMTCTIFQELNIAQTAAYGFVAETAALHFYQQKQVARHLFTFLWILSISLSDALPHFSRRVKLGSIALCVAHVVQMWLQVTRIQKNCLK